MLSCVCDSGWKIARNWCDIGGGIFVKSSFSSDEKHFFKNSHLAVTRNNTEGIISWTAIHEMGGEMIQIHAWCNLLQFSEFYSRNEVDSFFLDTIHLMEIDEILSVAF